MCHPVYPPAPGSREIKKTFRPNEWWLTPSVTLLAAHARPPGKGRKDDPGRAPPPFGMKGES
jgi:hypothetical protein